jgi:Flp pilus assembly protein TadG
MSVVRRMQQFGRNERGQALVEFALVMPILLLLIMGVVEFGRAWNLQQTITDAAREGARRAVVYDPALTRAEVEAAIQNKISASGFNGTAATITWCALCWDGAGLPNLGVGEELAVRVDMPYEFTFLKRLIDLVNTGSQGQVMLSTTTRMRKE